MPGRILVTFSIHYSTHWREHLFICGSFPELGAWKASAAVPLNYAGGNWVGTVSVPTGSVEYKYFVRSEIDNTMRWEEGANRQQVFTDDLARGEAVFVRDVWQLAPTLNDEIAASSAVRKVMLRRPNPSALPHLSERKKGRVVVQFEVPVPLLSPGETVCVVGSTPARAFWSGRKSFEMTDQFAPLFCARVEFGLEEFPITYKYMVTHVDGSAPDVIENDPVRTVHAPITIDAASHDPVVFGCGGAPLSFADAAAQGHLAVPAGETCFAARLLIVRDAPFRYPAPRQLRAAGMAIPVFSIRTESSVGCGEFADLPKMAEFCERCGLRMLQLLPITDTMVNFIHWSDSYPYSSVSAFALHPIYVSIPQITPLPDGMAARIETARKKLDLDKMDYSDTLRTKLGFLEEIYNFHLQNGNIERDAEFRAFMRDSQYWLPAYAAFKTLATRFGTTRWSEWPEEFRNPTAGLINGLCSPSHPDFPRVQFHMWVQHHLDRQLRAASEACAQRRVALKGDLPIGVDMQGADTWWARKFFVMTAQAGAPPDPFSAVGQNWKLPLYNWDAIIADNFEWWANRLRVMSRHFHAYRVDHILGFYRIWSIPAYCVSGMHGHFSPGQGIHRSWLEQHGIRDPFKRLTTPYITRPMVEQEFGAETDDIIRTFLHPTSDGLLAFKAEFDTEVKVASFEERRLNINNDSPPEVLKALDLRLKHFWMLTNSVCLYQDDEDPNVFYPRFGITKSPSWQALGQDWRAQLERLCNDYFYNWHDQVWCESAHRKFPHLKRASDMLICGEDLGLLAPCVAPIMAFYRLLGLRVQRMPADPKKKFSHPNDYEYGVVATTSTHDMPPLRAWWQISDRRAFTDAEWARHIQSEDYKAEDEKLTHFWRYMLANWGDRPAVLPADQVERIVDMHMFCPAALAVFPLQDLLAIVGGDLVHENPHAELINNPANRKHYWQYRMRPTVEYLLQQTALITRIRGKVEASHR